MVTLLQVGWGNIIVLEMEVNRALQKGLMGMAAVNGDGQAVDQIEIYIFEEVLMGRPDNRLTIWDTMARDICCETAKAYWTLNSHVRPARAEIN